jgi:Flp pilus assembly protein TadD
MNILFAALDQAARAPRTAHGVVDTPFPPVFSMRRRPAHIPWWLALIGGIGIGFSSTMGFWHDSEVSAASPLIATVAQPVAIAPLPPRAAAPVQLATIEVPVHPPLVAPRADAPIQQSDTPVDDKAPGLSILHTEHGSTPTQQTLTRAQSAARAGDFAAAIVGYNEILARDPTSRDALAGKAFALQQSGSATEAAVIWARLYQSDPNDQTALANVAANLTAVNDAVSHDRLTQMQAMHPKSAILYAVTAQARVKRGDLTGTQSDLERAWALDRDNPITRLNLAIVADRSGDSTAALKLYRQVLADPVAAETLLPMSWTAIETRANYLAQRTSP